MNARQYLEALDRLALRQMDVAELLDIASRTSRRWETGEAPVPRAVALVLHMMIAKNLKPADALALIESAPKAKKAKRKKRKKTK